MSHWFAIETGTPASAAPGDLPLPVVSWDPPFVSSLLASPLSFSDFSKPVMSWNTPVATDTPPSALFFSVTLLELSQDPFRRPHSEIFWTPSKPY